ncbi:transposase-like protein [Chryseobacterium vietnamense]|uniref:transposase n=1 Tax=Chryseobacterium vietnamense TaxID=866785 RepID=UPI00285B1D87|nr:transposase [Chryseobacterium vietnamense]MDR6489902.1 transposase-like protein [Chryseobacterium vietnamense]
MKEKDPFDFERFKAEAIQGLYEGKSLSPNEFIREMYAMEISATEISRITESVLPAVNEWRSRPLEAVYPFVFLDCMHIKVRQNGTVESRAIYNILGVGMDGRKDLIGLYSSENKGLSSGFLCLQI